MGKGPQQCHRIHAHGRDLNLFAGITVGEYFELIVATTAHYVGCEDLFSVACANMQEIGVTWRG